ELRIDDTAKEISAALMNDHGASHLHLGYLTHPRPDGGAPRGEGFELRSDLHGALRAAQGLLLTTEAQAEAGGGQLDRQEVVAALEAALQLARTLGDYAGQHQGLAHDAKPRQTLTEAVRAMGHGANDQANGGGDGSEPLIALSAPAGIAVGTPRAIALGAGEHLDAAAQGHVQLTSGERTVINAGNGLSTFAQQGDMRHIAHQGELLLQAQHNSARLEAEQSVEMTASQGHMLWAAGKRITLMCGGAYIEMQGGDIEMGMPGLFIVKGASHNLDGASTGSATLPLFKAPTVGDFEARYRMRKTDERAFQGYRYRLLSQGQLVAEGWTNDEGETESIETESPRLLQAYKTIMRDDQRITEDWLSNIEVLDESRPHKDAPSPFADDFLDEYQQEDI
ncbi:type VI secretion system Vgr family protein, partial [Pseudomonas aeruginosa]|uniref:type VI secretion system Vgr family protein n=2 Tax=Pseudomonas aeruginosa TaxID=287 RepID=UPI0005B8E395